MAKQLNFTYGDKEYTLEFTRKTVMEMEKNGFIVTELTDKPETRITELFAGAFLAHHRYVKPETITDIYESLTKKDEIIGKLVEMYNEPILALVNSDGGNLEWTVNW